MLQYRKTCETKWCDCEMCLLKHLAEGEVSTGLCMNSIQCRPLITCATIVSHRTIALFTINHLPTHPACHQSMPQYKINSPSQTWPSFNFHAYHLASMVQTRTSDCRGQFRLSPGSLGNSGCKMASEQTRPQSNGDHT